MKNHTLLLPRMAGANIRKNGSIYFPYIGVSIFAVFTYFVFDLILKNDIMYTLPRGVYAVILVTIGFGLLGLIMIPFLYYTNSFLIKRRKKELGLYSILGLEKKHIGIMMFWESAAMYVIVTAAAIGLGLLFSRLIFLLLLNLAKMPINVEFSVSPRAVTDTLLFYAFITGLNLFVNLVQVGKSNPVELMSDSKRGEKEPRWIGLWSLAGAAALLMGYRLALKAQLDTYIFLDFFLAVFLVIVGTYFLFTSGSIAVLRFFKKRKKIYYSKENFVTISGMLYRMKKNAASLSNICIFSTMVVITVVCTVALYLGMDSIVRANFIRDFEIYFLGNDRMDEEVLKQETAALAARSGVELQLELDYSYVGIRAYRKGNVLQVEGEPYDYSGWADVFFMTQEEYCLLEGVQENLQAGEVLVFFEGPDFGQESICFETLEYTVKREMQESRLVTKQPDNTFGNMVLVVFADREELKKAAAVYGVGGGEQISYIYGFQPQGQEAAVDSFSAQLEKYVSKQAGFATYEDRREHIKEVESMYGGLLFIGVFYGAIFLICLLIIMYYKQITEGFEDQKNFQVMQKVGMSDREIRCTIKRQVSTVFGLPLLGAILHTAVGMRMVYLLLGAIGFFEKGLLIGCTVGGCLVFGLVYSLCYRSTSRAYYRIVK